MEEMHKRVLVVDDDPSIRGLICALVRRENIAADCVADGFDAIEKLEKNDYAVILLDLMMPRLDGFGVVRWLKEHPRRVKPLVFVITAYGDHAFKRVDSDIVAGIIHKPFDVQDVGALIRQCALGDETELARLLRHSRDRALSDFDSFIEWTEGREERSSAG